MEQEQAVTSAESTAKISELPATEASAETAEPAAATIQAPESTETDLMDCDNEEKSKESADTSAASVNVIEGEDAEMPEVEEDDESQIPEVSATCEDEPEEDLPKEIPVESQTTQEDAKLPETEETPKDNAEKETADNIADADNTTDVEKGAATETKSSETESPPIEEIDASNKEDNTDEAPETGDDDPLMKDSECQADEPPADGTTPQEKTDAPASADRITLSVKPPGELLESNFVDVACEDSMPSESMDFDPIANEGSNDAHEGDLFNGKEAETILAEDDAEQPAEAEAAPEEVADVDKNKYVIILANRNEKATCTICKSEEVPLYLAHKDSEESVICTIACLDKFKEQHGDNYIERILRLRVFATAEPAPCKPAESFIREVEEENRVVPSFRKCGKCKISIDTDNYLCWEALDFCDEGCLSEFQSCINRRCARCLMIVPEHLLGKYCVRFGTTVTQFCKTACLISYKKSRKLCQYCQEDLGTARTDGFCSKRCKDTSTPGATEPKESSLCSVCGQVKEVELKVRDAAKMDCICSDRCFVAYKFVNKIELVKCEVCPTTFERKPADQSVYEDNVVHNLCSKECQKIYLITHRVIVNCNICLVKKYDFDMIRVKQTQKSGCVCSLNCLSIKFESEYTQKSKSFEANVRQLRAVAKDNDFIYEGKNLGDLIELSINAGKMSIQKIIVTKPRLVPRQRNKAVMCKPRLLTKAIQSKDPAKMRRSVHMQTDDTFTRWIPIPVPIYVPMPLHMHVQPVPMLVPIPIPFVIPIFILTGRRSIKGIAKEIQKIKSRIPADPLEAEILMMADMAAGDKRDDPASDSEDDVHDPNKMLDTTMVNAIDTASTSFSDDVLSMAFKMANEYTEPLDLESEVDNSTRMLAGRRPQMYKPRGRPQRMEIVKPDENLALKYTFGVNAWKQWATHKNQELSKLKNAKFVKLDLLQLSAEDLCFYLCQFVKEVRKPNGGEYASDTVYYLCLGIQLYLYENGRIDNLFCDPYYEKFTDTFNEVCMSFCQLYNENQYIVTRVEEEHLWESKQLGAHSPLVLLNTLLFFNTKHFNLTTVEDHLQLSFSHIMKHWKRNANAPNQRNVLLRFYPPSKGSWGKRKVYEQQECLENPLRCPVRLYEFFLSKCPESVKTRNDVFYLQPERSCVPDSPVWYSTSALDRDQLEKMLNRMKIIKEISMAILGT